MVLVMLDLLAEADAEEILQAHQRGLDALGVDPGGCVATGTDLAQAPAHFLHPGHPCPGRKWE